MWLTRLSLRRPVTLAMALTCIAILGIVSVFRLPLEFLPQMEMPFIGVWVPYENSIPEQAERDIVRPIEEILSTLGGVRDLRSNCDDSDAFVGVEFDFGRDVNLMRLEVKEKIDQIRNELPADIRQILLLTFSTSDIPIVEGRISARGRDLSESWDLLEQKIINPLERIPGVGQVNIDGVLPTQASVFLNYDRIIEFGVDVGRLFEDLSAANVELTVGRVTDQGLRYDVRTVSNLRGVEDLGELPIGTGGLRLKQIADVVYGAPALSYGRYLNREPAIAFWIQKASGYNTVAVCRAIERELEKINLDPTLEGIDSFTFFNQADQITDGLRSLLQAGLFGSLLSIVILYIFLRRVSMTIVVSVAIPISILGALIYLYITGGNLNVLSMMGLMLGVGMLVDNAVVVLESIYRRQSLGASPVSAAIRGTREVGRAIVASTLTTIAVFAPIILTKSDELAVWLAEVGVTISVTLVFSLLVSLTVIPMLSVRLTRSNNGGGQVPDARWLVSLRKHYERVLRWTALKHPGITAFAIVPAVLALTAVFWVVTDFKPDSEGEGGIRRESLYVDFEYSGPVDKRTAEDYVMTATEYLETRRDDLGLRDIYSYYVADGGGVSIFFESGVVSENFFREVREDLRENLPVQAGLEYRFGGEDGDESGAKTFAVTISGEETELLHEFAEEAKRRLATIEGVHDLRSDGDQGQAEVRVAVDSERAARFGIRPATVSQVLGLTYRGVQLPRLNTGQREIDLVVSLEPEARESFENLSTLTVGMNEGQPILLGQLADFTFGRSPERLYRRNQKSGVTLSGSYEGDKLDDALDQIRPLMNNLEMPIGYDWDFGSRIRQAQQQNSEMGVNMLLSLACVFFIMASLFESLMYPLIVMGCVPFASVGVFWLMMATGTPFNIMAMIGMVILIGIVVNNGIVLVDHINNNRRGGMPLGEAIVKGGGDRLRPILMTAGTTILGLSPLALVHGAHVGDAEYYPMARAICGGLASSTLLTLIIMPTHYRIATDWAAAISACRRRRRPLEVPADVSPEGA